MRTLHVALLTGLLACLLPLGASADPDELVIWKGDTVVAGPEDARAVIVDTLVLHEGIVSARPTTRRLAVTGLEPGTSLVRAYGRTRNGQTREAWSILVRVLDAEEIRSDKYVVVGTRSPRYFGGTLRLGTRDGLEGPEDRRIARVTRNTDHQITVHGRRVGTTTLVARHTREGEDGSEERFVETITIHVVASEDDFPRWMPDHADQGFGARARDLPRERSDDGFPVQEDPEEARRLRDRVRDAFRSERPETPRANGTRSQAGDAAYGMPALTLPLPERRAHREEHAERNPCEARQP